MLLEIGCMLSLISIVERHRFNYEQESVYCEMKDALLESHVRL